MKEIARRAKKDKEKNIFKSIEAAEAFAREWDIACVVINSSRKRGEKWTGK